MLREQAFVPRGWQKSTSPEISIAVISGVESACFSNAWLTEHSLFWSCFVHRLPRPFLAVYVIIHCQKAGKGRMAVYVAFWRCMLFSAIGYRPFWRCMSTFWRWIRPFSGEFPRVVNSLPPGGFGRTLGYVSFLCSLLASLVSHLLSLHPSQENFFYSATSPQSL